MSLLSSNNRKRRLSKTGRQAVCRLLSCLVSEHQHKKRWCSPARLCAFFVSSKLSFPHYSDIKACSSTTRKQFNTVHWVYVFSALHFVRFHSPEILLHWHSKNTQFHNWSRVLDWSLWQSISGPRPIFRASIQSCFRRSPSCSSPQGAVSVSPSLSSKHGCPSVQHSSRDLENQCKAVLKLHPNNSVCWFLL